MSGLLLRNVEIDGRAGMDVRIERGRVVEIGERLAPAGDDIDGRGGALLPGLIDHHIHLLGTAAQAASVRLDGLDGPAAFAAALRDAAARRTPGQWIRATGYDERLGDLPDRALLDRLVPGHPLRVLDRTGGLWMLNSMAIDRVAGGELPACVERDAEGAPTGRIWRGDAWLRSRIGKDPPPLAPIGAALARYGITGVTDASVTNDADAANLLAEARRSGALPQRLHLMSGGPLATPDRAGFTIGPLKILLDDRDLPDLDELGRRIALARSGQRAVAVHCVTAGELAITLAAFEAFGAEAGDRIEHGGMIHADAIDAIARLGLAVVTQSIFVADRGDGYIERIAADEHGDLYRCASLIAAGIPTAGSSDAPYGDPDCWRAMRAACERVTRGGQLLGAEERVSPAVALGLYGGSFDRPGGGLRRIACGMPADLCLLDQPFAVALESLDAKRVAATLIDGQLVYRV